MEYHIRYTCSGELQQQIVEFITKNANKYIIAREFATREHIQCYVETNITKKTWVNKFNLKFKNMDRRDKYVEPDKGRTKQYVCKDGDIIIKRGFTDEDVMKYRQEYLDSQTNEEIKKFCDTLPEIKDENLEKPKKAPKKPPFMKQCRDELLTLYPDKDWTMNDKPIVYKRVMYNLAEGCKTIDHYIISRMTYGVLNSLIKTKQEWLEYWYQKSFGEALIQDDSDKFDIFTDSKYLI